MDASAFGGIGKGLVGFCIGCVVITIIITALVTSCVHRVNDKNKEIDKQRQEILKQLTPEEREALGYGK